LIAAYTVMILIDSCSGEGSSAGGTPSIGLIFDPLVKTIFVELMAAE